MEKIVNAILGTIMTALARGDRVELRGFGVFAVKTRGARTGRNPRDGSKVVVSEGGPDLQDEPGQSLLHGSGGWHLGMAGVGGRSLL